MIFLVRLYRRTFFLSLNGSSFNISLAGKTSAFLYFEKNGSMSKRAIIQKEDYDVICVGAGIMSATLALMLKLLDPKMKILILERLDKVAQESSAAQNNAGTGHSGFCELNYTPEKETGERDALRVANYIVGRKGLDE